MSETSHPLATLTTPARHRTATGWAAPHVIAASPRRYLIGLAARIGALILFASADVIFIKTTIDIVLLSADAISWLVAVLLAIGAVVMAVTTGHLAHVAAAEGQRQLPAHLLIVGWVALGVALVAMRFNAAAWTATPIQVEGVAAPAFDEAAVHRGMAVLLALIYLASGVWGYVEGRHLFNPFAQTYVAGLLRRPALAARVVSQSGLVNRSVEDLRRGRQQVETLTATRRAAENARRSLAAELMAQARVRIANSLGDPASTGITELTPTYKSIVTVTESTPRATDAQDDDRVTRSIVAIATVSLMGVVFAGCASSTDTSTSPACTPYSRGVVLVVGVHANEAAPDLTTGIVCRVTETIAVGMPVAAIAVDGAPRVLLPAQTYPIAGDNTAARRNGITHAVASIVAAVQSAKPERDGSDLLAGLILGARVAGRGPSAIGDLVVVDSGVTDTGLALTIPGGTLVEAGEVTQHEFAVHALDPDQFHGLHVAFWGLGETRAPQGELSLRQRDAISDLWPGIVRAAQGSSESVPFPRSGADVNTSHKVATVEVINPDPFQPHAGDVLRFDGSTDLAFVADRARLVDEKGGRALLAPIAAWLAADPARTADIVGRTSSANPSRNAALSLARAQVRAQILLDAGAGVGQVHAEGRGYTADPPDTLPDGSLDPTAAALNRVVEITLH